MKSLFYPHRLPLLFCGLFLIISISSHAQVGINTTNPDNDAILDVVSTAANPGGLLLPRVALTGTANVAPLSAHVQGMTVYNTATAADVTPGYYYNNGTQWVRLAADAPSDDWSRVGNAGTVAGTNFLGTTDNISLRIRTNNTDRFDFSTNGRLRSYNNGSASQPTYSWTSDTDMGIYRIGTNILGFSTAGNESMRILADGRIAVNTTSAISDTRLTVAESGGNRAIYGNSQSGEAIRGEATSGTGVVGIASSRNAQGGYFLNTQTNGFGIWSLGGGSSFYSFPDSGTGAAITGRTFGSTNIATATNGEGVAGIGDDLGGLPTRPLGVGVVGYGYQAGVYGESGYYSQPGIFGRSEGNPSLSSNGIGVYGENVNNLGFGLYGTSTNIGIYGTGAHGGIFESSNNLGFGAIIENLTNNGIGLLVAGQNLGPSTLPGSGAVFVGDETAGAGFANNIDGTGIIGAGNAITVANVAANGAGVAGTGNTVGVYGKGIQAVDGIGVVGAGNNLLTYTIPANGAGIAGTGENIGVYGHATNAAGFGVYSSGDLHTEGNVTISGNLNVGGNTTVMGTKSFMIDDPRDPANKYLKHFSVESNEILNIYRGVALFDASGEAVVQLPDYYDAINKNASYQLTPIGVSMPNLFIAKEVSDGVFVIAGGIPSKKVSWTLTAERNDPYISNNPDVRINVVDKGEYRGSYLAPKTYGQSAEKGILSSTNSENRLAPIFRKIEVISQQVQSQEMKANKVHKNESRNLTLPSNNMRSELSNEKILRNATTNKAQKGDSPNELSIEISEDVVKGETQNSTSPQTTSEIIKRPPIESAETPEKN